MRSTKIISILILTPLIVGCSIAAKFSSEEEYTDMMESLFRYVFANNGSALQGKADFYFISIDGKDPSDALLNRLKGYRPIASKATLASTDKNTFSRVIHATEKGPGVLFDVQNIKKISNHKYIVTLNLYEAPLSSSSANVSMLQTNGKWQVKYQEITLNPKVSKHCWSAHLLSKNFKENEKEIYKIVADQSEYIFIGETLMEEKAEDHVNTGQSARGKARFAISEIYKGELNSRASVRDGRINDCGCKYEFKTGVEYLVIANRIGNDFVTFHCDFIKPKEQAMIKEFKNYMRPLK